MRLVRKSLDIRAVKVSTFSQSDCVTLLNKGFGYLTICGKFHTLVKRF